MENLTDSIVSSILNSLDPNPVNPKREQLYLAVLICKNLSDLCETGRAIVNSMESNGNPIDGLPDRSNIAMCQQILGKFYSNDMFIEDTEFGNKPNWQVISSFKKDRGDTAYKIYRAIRKNIIEKPGGQDIQKAIERKDKEYFIGNFDKIFIDIPFKDALLKFKNFVSSPYALAQDQTYVWDFFEALLDIFIFEADHLRDLSKMH
jgi:hypothetical protein